MRLTQPTALARSQDWWICVMIDPFLHVFFHVAVQKSNSDLSVGVHCHNIFGVGWTWKQNLPLAELSSPGELCCPTDGFWFSKDRSMLVDHECWVDFLPMHKEGLCLFHCFGFGISIFDFWEEDLDLEVPVLV